MTTNSIDELEERAVQEETKTEETESHSEQNKMTSIKSTTSIIHDGLYVTIGSIFVFLFSYAFRIVLARYLSVEEYGLFYSIWNFLTFFLFFIYLGLDQASVHYVVKYKVEGNYGKIKSVILSTLAFQLLTTSIFIVCIFFTAGFLEEHYFRYPGSGFLLMLMSIFLLFNVLGGLSSYILYGFQRLKVYAFYAPVQAFLYLTLFFVFWGLGTSLSAPYWTYVATSLLLVLIFLPFSWKVFPFFRHKAADFWEVTKQLFLYGLPVILTAISSRLLIQTDTLMLTRMASLQEVGLYQAALPIATLLTFLSAGVLTVLFPLFTELWHRGEKERIELYLRYIYKYLLLISLPLVILFMFFSKWLILWMFGEGYLGAQLALIILLAGALFNLFSSINLQSIAAFGNPKLVSKIVLVGALANVALNALFIYLWGINGAALATSLCYVLMWWLSGREMKKYVSVQGWMNWPLFSWNEVKMIKEMVWKR